MRDPQELISAYFDDSLASGELEQLRAWLQAAPENKQEFVRASMLHSRVRDLLHEREVRSLFAEPGEAGYWVHPGHIASLLEEEEAAAGRRALEEEEAMRLAEETAARRQELLLDRSLLADPPVVEVPDVVESPLDVTYLLPQPCVVVSLRPQQIMHSPLLKLMPIEVVQAASLQQTGIDALLMDRLLISMEPPAAGPPNYAVMASFTAPVADKLLPEVVAKMEKLEEERPHHQPIHPTRRPGVEPPLVVPHHRLQVAHHVDPESHGQGTAFLAPGSSRLRAAGAITPYADDRRFPCHGRRLRRGAGGADRDTPKRGGSSPIWGMIPSSCER